MLDLGCGDGTTALPAARLGADVLGVDIAANLVAAGNERAAAAGLDNLRFQEGDASDLADLADDSFDLVVSIFGAMFAPRPFDVAKEMVRVARPGGRIVMGNWIPGDPTLVAQILKISGAYSPPPPEGFVSPVTWGVENDVLERFAAAGIAPERVSTERATWTFVHPGTPTELLGEFRDYYGPTMNAYAAAAADGRDAELQAELADLFERAERRHRRLDPDPGDVPARHRRDLTTTYASPAARRASRVFAMSTTEGAPALRLSELLGVLSFGVDLGMGQPMEHVLRQAMIALGLAERIGLDADERDAVYFGSLLAWVGCHIDAYEQAKWFGDETALKHDARLIDFAAASSGPLFMLRHLGGDRPLPRRVAMVPGFFGEGRREARVDARQPLARLRRPDGADRPRPADPRHGRTELRALGRARHPARDRAARRSSSPRGWSTSPTWSRSSTARAGSRRR